jgi:hypothetical protein
MQNKTFNIDRYTYARCGRSTDIEYIQKLSQTFDHTLSYLNIKFNH